ncbi:2,3-bisphosphoglycerate-independent phosphoglycerate mutase [Flavobacteriales bacterium]|nr:2,3-bisphosphoglycerate-independent phosphoglycerate mutase [Flavobacteriales bacterium]
MTNKKVALIILDGWGQGAQDESDGIFRANTPFIDSLYTNWANAQLVTFGKDVGLPSSQMGNSEVGHLNIGAGRIVFQDLLKIDNAIADRSFHNHPQILGAFQKAKKTNKKVHFFGLVSDGGVHSSIEHLIALCDVAEKQGLVDVFIHAITDGRDCGPETGINHLEKLEKHIEKSNAKVASVIGRYYAMDRDKRWGRIKKAYDLLVRGVGNQYHNATQGIRASYDSGVTDEFIEPITITNESGQPIALIEEDDLVICFNFRTDRCREITIALTQEEFQDQKMRPLKLDYYTMTNYDDSFQNINVIYKKDHLSNTLGEVISNAGKKQIRIAETEKYPHVTFFFSGGREAEFEGEKRIIVSSPNVATYDLQPEMSAPEVTSKICHELNTGESDFICLNFANPDMVGHTGIPTAIISAIETIDQCTQKVVETGLNNNYSFVIIADHGNADKMFNSDGSPHTAHTTNMVPVFVLNNEVNALKNGILADVAPTILHLLGIEQPLEMTGCSLIKKTQQSLPKK